VATLFADDHTHTTPAGARLNAESVIDGLAAIESPLTRYVVRSTSRPPTP
jgi:hypothetical protein